ncbi:sigma 54-interacting transcriptional regulator [Terriglobus saanensis]|uniref:sigma 54-interacting transcriptional regulator n=1 Tax=Terriglobus saanensis TaxID=870903 RepID=UPI00030DAB91|nr:sigma 54-interacting transcriptional regulator [Terriglobus saanensis]
MAQKRGKSEAADGGTIFLDAIGQLPLALEPKVPRPVRTHLRADRHTASLHVDVTLPTTL